jgi:hypothetical protein
VGPSFSRRRFISFLSVSDLLDGGYATFVKSGKRRVVSNTGTDDGGLEWDEVALVEVIAQCDVVAPETNGRVEFSVATPDNRDRKLACVFYPAMGPTPFPVRDVIKSNDVWLRCVGKLEQRSGKFLAYCVKTMHKDDVDAVNNMMGLWALID